ncbi:Hypothetical protein POVR2_LOCUS46 [uncultured virus]|nr:Hypothetical protein POVR2_LOCUS46 [uncultured virus]
MNSARASSLRAHFEVQVVSAQAERFVRDGYEYVSLPSGSIYSLHLVNNGNTQCDAVVMIDNTKVGTWRIEAGDSITIDRPANINRKFTFVDESSSVARQTGNRVGDENNGLIKIAFKPAKQEQARSSPRLAGARAAAPTIMRAYSPRLSSGVTVLGDRSDQEFNSISSLRDSEIDWAGVVEINIRLVVRASSRQRYVGLAPYTRNDTASRVSDKPSRIDSYYNSRRVD